jgi:glycosyltransferase involved in cell wall biosynthesis
MTSPGISLFVPVYNEEELIGKNTAILRDALARSGRPFEIVIVSNGSIDATVTLGTALAADDPRIVFASLERRGPGLALTHAIDLFRHDHVVTMDIDLSVEPDFITQADQALETHAVVLGSKRTGSENRSWIRRIGSAVFIAAGARLLGLPYSDYSIGAKGYRRDFLKHHRSLIDRETGYVLPLALAATREGIGVIELPIHCVDHRASRFNLLYEGFYRFAHLAHLWWKTGR